MTGYSTTPCRRRSLRKQDLVDGVDRAVAGLNVGLEQMRGAHRRALAVDAEGDLATGRGGDQSAGHDAVVLAHADRDVDDVAQQHGLEAGRVAQQRGPLRGRQLGERLIGGRVDGQRAGGPQRVVQTRGVDRGDERVEVLLLGGHVEHRGGRQGGGRPGQGQGEERGGERSAYRNTGKAHGTFLRNSVGAYDRSLRLIYYFHKRLFHKGRLNL